jgi:diacylglycerol kinase (ATP)
MNSLPIEHIKLIFNPLSGRAEAFPSLLQQVIGELQKLNYIPEIYLTEPDVDIEPVLNMALKQKIRLFVVCGGDGTIETVARWMIGKRATLGIIPAGTQNNLSLSLGIPTEIKTAAALLRSGQRSKVDIGIAHSGNQSVPFLEVCSIGLFSAIMDSADNLQKGDLASLGNIMNTLTTFPSASIKLVLDKKTTTYLQGHVAMVANLPYFGLNYRLSPNNPFDDGIMDVLVFTDFSKLELVGNVLQNAEGEGKDKRIQRFRARRLIIESEPTLPVTADGTALGSTPVSITTRRKALSVITGLPAQGQPRWSFLRNINIFKFLRR